LVLAEAEVAELVPVRRLKTLLELAQEPVQQESALLFLALQ
jgi:hypothetical protein